MMRGSIVVLGSFCLTLGVLINAYQLKKQFYPSVVYITKSSPGMAILYLQAFVFVILMGKVMRKIFFGQLRAAEMEHLLERSWYAITETCLAFTVFRDDFSPKFVALFTVLLFLKCFHWLIEDRVDYMERSPVISLLFHARVVSLASFLGLLDGLFINNAYYSTLLKGASVQLVFGFEYAILLTIVVHSFTKYVLHTLDLQNENTWENKAVYLLYAELVLSFIKVVLYMLFLAIMIKVHTFPLFAIRPMYHTIRTFKKAVNDVIMSRRAISNMNNLYPAATSEELAEGDNVCIICREDMVSGSKKLPCGHIFHTSCLRSWFQRQQTCPTCRMDILRASGNRDNANQQQPQQQQGAQQQVPQPGAPPPQEGVGPGASSSSAPTSPTSSTPQTMPPGAMPPFMMPPFMMSMPFTVPPPMPPTDFTGLTDEEVRSMEGDERRNVEARVQVLRNIQTLLDAAMIQMQQYTAVATRWNSPPPFPMTTPDSTTETPNSATATTVTPNSATVSTVTPNSATVTTLTTATAATNVTSSAAAETTMKPSAVSPNTVIGDQSKKTDAGKDVPDTANKDKDDHGLGEATGGSSPPTETTEDPQKTSGEDTNEVRRRRLERFMSADLASS